MKMSFPMESEKENKLSFLDVEVICKRGKCITSNYKPSFKKYSNFESFLTSVYKFAMVYALIY